MSDATSTTTRVRRRRSTVKQDRITESLRQQIVTGRFKPGGRLPNQIDLVRQFNASTVTVQRALERLARDGLVRSEPRQGVFVDEHPPHLVDYCLIFPHDVAKMAQHNRFLFSLSQIAAGLSSEGPRRASIYYGVESPDDSPAYRDLLRQVQAHGMAGMIFLTPPARFAGTPILTTTGIPRVAIMREPTLPGVAAVQVQGFPDLAIEHLIERGCKRLAMVTVPQASETALTAIMERARVGGASLPRHHILAVDPFEARWAQHAVTGLFAGGTENQPDGLIISDDNLVPHATAGLLAAEIREPRRCHVVAHANFPWKTESLVPAKRIGHDVREVFKAYIGLIDRARRGEELPDRLTVGMTIQAESDPASEPATHPSVN